jgi:chemotaxis protein histidine kinase CheA
MGEPALDLTEIIELYREDAKIMVGKMEAALSRWPEVQQGGEARQILRRISHQLRGSGRTYGFRDVTRIGKAIENIMLKLEKATVPANDRARDAIRQKISRIAAAFKK